MSILGWFSGLFGDSPSGAGISDSDAAGAKGGMFENDLMPGTDPSSDDNAINPANGLPMVGGDGGIDVEGNPYGTDHHHDSFSGIDDSFDIGGGFDDW